MLTLTTLRLFPSCTTTTFPSCELSLVLRLCVCAFLAVAVVFVSQRWRMCGVKAAEEYYTTARTGDLIFFRSAEVDPVHDVVSWFTHVGVVVKQPGMDPTLAEMHEGTATQRPGLHFNDVRRRVTEFRGRAFVVPVHKTVDGTEVMRVIRSVDNPYPRHLRNHVAKCALLPGYKSAPGNRPLMCSEFVLRVLDTLGVLRCDYRCKTPADAMTLSHLSGEFGCVRELI